jgi:hypothetical protein
MPDKTPVPPPPQPASQYTQGPTIHIADEFGTAKRNLPPARFLLAAIGGVLVLAGIIAFLQRAKPQGAGSLDNVTAVEIPNQNAVLVALTFTLHNSGEKSLWVHDIRGHLAARSGDQTGDTVSPMDFDRYYQAFPALKTNALPPLVPEDKLQPGQELKRTVIVSFPVTLEAFNQRSAVSVVVQPYDQPVPVILTK